MPKEHSVKLFIFGIETLDVYQRYVSLLSTVKKIVKLSKCTYHLLWQAQVFSKPKGGVRKVVIATNLAETSITIDDCVYVIDVGRMKENRFDPNKSMESLETVWVSKANALQVNFSIDFFYLKWTPWLCVLRPKPKLNLSGQAF